MSDWITSNQYLSLADMQHNADLFYEKMSGYGFSVNAIAGMLGNIQTESSVNPGIWQSLKPFKGGYGLVQWTPYTKYSDWAGSGWENNGDKECERIAFEFDNGIQYYPTSAYPITAYEFKTSDMSPEYLATAFLYNYERPANLNQPNRRKQAAYWYEYLEGKPSPPDPAPPDPPEPTGATFPFWMLFRFGTMFNKWGTKSTH